jgi:hypothetical protein
VERIGRYALAVFAEAQRTLELSMSLDSIKGLKPPELANARVIQSTLQVAGRPRAEAAAERWRKMREEAKDA